MIAYTVTAELPNADLRREYIAWLGSGHLDDVIDAGALSGSIVRIDDPAEPFRVETRYLFTGRHDLEVYLRDHAPALRADGLARFGPKTGVRFSRTVGELI